MLNRRELITTALLGAAATPTALAASATPAAVNWEAIKKRMLIPPDVAYLNTGTLGAMPRDVLEAITAHMRAFETKLASYDYVNDAEPPLTGYAPFNDQRAKLAALIHADFSEVAFTQNATMGMSFVANGLPLNAGDEVLMTDQEHPGGGCPWVMQKLRRGIVLKEIPVAPPATPEEIVERFRAAITPKTRAIVAAHLTSALGLLLPIQKLCALAKEHGAYSIIDGAQVVGQLQLDVKALGCDFYVSSPHKWLLAPKGTGLLYMRREQVEKVATTLASSHWNDLKEDAWRLQQFGTGSLSQLAGLMAAVDFHDKLGSAVIEERVRALTKRLRAGLASMKHVRISSSVHPEMIGAVTTFKVEGKKAADVQNALWAKKIRVRAINDDAGVRAGTHFYVLEREIDRLLELVRGMV